MRLTLLALATLVPISVLTVFSYVEEQRQRRDDAEREAGDYSESVAASIDSLAQDLESLTLATSLSLGSQTGPISNAANQAFLAALAKETGILRTVFVTDTEGRLVAQSSGDDTGRDISARPYIQELKAGAEIVWSGGLEGIETGQVTVAFARVVRAPDGAARGYLVVAFYPAVLSSRLPVPERGNIVLVDQGAQLLFSSADPSLTSTTRDAGDSPEVRAALTGKRVDFKGQDTPFDSGARFGTLSPIPTMNWALGYTRSQSGLNASLRAGLARDLGVLALIGAVSVIAVLLVARQVSRPLGQLATAVSNLRAGEGWELRPTSEPDVSRLQSAFLTMRADVESREKQLEDQAKLLDTLEKAGHILASELDFDATVQAVTDAGVRVTEASFGALFFNMVTPEGEAYQLYTLSGAPRSAFDGFGMPRNTAIFGPTFRGEGPTRMEDVTADPRYGLNAPHSGVPEGHPPIRSFLAVPVIARSGSVLGGLFFGHLEVGKFTEQHERLALGIASWASIALDNARLFESAQERERQLVKANSAKDEFLGLVSHELRTPITIVMGAAKHLSEQRDTLDAETEELLLRDVRDSAARLSQLVHNILVLARVERLGVDQSEPVLLRRSVEQVCREFSAHKPERPLRLNLLESGVIVPGSNLYLEQVIGNLVSNADKYSPAGEPIDVTLDAADGYARVTVRDRGAGLSEEDSEHIFEPYYRGTEASKRATGFGLGLAVCKALAEAMGGSLAFSNHPEGGAEFALAVPLLAESSKTVESHGRSAAAEALPA